ncbi:hypothetical protein [Enterococcus ureilyticus]|nr:hypothetical protein [Enterococcus ureilyticus]
MGKHAMRFLNIILLDVITQVSMTYLHRFLATGKWDFFVIGDLL